MRGTRCPEALCNVGRWACGHAGRQVWAAVEDAARLRDALAVELPDGVPAVFLQPASDPLGELRENSQRLSALAMGR